MQFSNYFASSPWIALHSAQIITKIIIYSTWIFHSTHFQSAMVLYTISPKLFFILKNCIFRKSSQHVQDYRLQFLHWANISEPQFFSLQLSIIANSICYVNQITHFISWTHSGFTYTCAREFSVMYNLTTTSKVILKPSWLFVFVNLCCLFLHNICFFTYIIFFDLFFKLPKRNISTLNTWILAFK